MMLYKFDLTRKNSKIQNTKKFVEIMWYFCKFDLTRKKFKIQCTKKFVKIMRYFYKNFDLTRKNSIIQNTKKSWKSLQLWLDEKLNFNTVCNNSIGSAREKSSFLKLEEMTGMMITISSTLCSTIYDNNKGLELLLQSKHVWWLLMDISRTNSLLFKEKKIHQKWSSSTT